MEVNAVRPSSPTLSRLNIAALFLFINSPPVPA
jgi:hypothetical protein